MTVTREDDIEDDGLSWRVEVARNFRADIFVSLHCNSCENTEAHGTEVWYFPDSEAGRSLARCIQGAVVQNCDTADRGVKTNGTWTVLRETSCPAVLVEMAIISNDRESESLTDKFLQWQLAVGIYNGIAKFSQSGVLPDHGDVVARVAGSNI